MHSGTFWQAFWNILHAFWNILHAFFNILHAFWNILHGLWIILEHLACILEHSACILEHFEVEFQLGTHTDTQTIGLVELCLKKLKSVCLAWSQTKDLPLSMQTL